MATHAPSTHTIKSMSAQELMQATLRLSDLVAQESTLLDERRYGEIAKLQEEKLHLTGLLESYQHVLSSSPDFLRNADIKVREELIMRTDDLAYHAEDNFRKVAVARAINQRVMQAIRDVISEQHSPSVYSRDGTTPAPDSLALSMNLNQKA